MLGAHARQEIADIGDDAPRPVDIFLAGRGQAQLPRRAMKQRRADPCLQLGDPFCDHRSRDVELSCRGGKSGRVRGGEERLKVYQDVHL